MRICEDLSKPKTPTANESLKNIHWGLKSDQSHPLHAFMDIFDCRYYIHIIIEPAHWKIC